MTTLQTTHIKRCSKCHIFKPLEQFGVEKRRPDGRCCACLECHASQVVNRTLNRSCLQCGVSFYSSPGHIRQGLGLFCSSRCYGDSRIVLPTDITDRFYFCVGKKQPNGCILWAGISNANGYGYTYALDANSKRINIGAHRVSYEIFVGPIPSGLSVLHRCDNPPCVNPVHLFVGTAADNSADACAKGRIRRGERPGVSKLTEAAVRQIRIRYASGGVTQKKLAAEYGISMSVLGRIIRRIDWKHVQD